MTAPIGSSSSTAVATPLAATPTAFNEGTRKGEAMGAHALQGRGAPSDSTPLRMTSLPQAKPAETASKAPAIESKVKKLEQQLLSLRERIAALATPPKDTEASPQVRLRNAHDAASQLHPAVDELSQLQATNALHEDAYKPATDRKWTVREVMSQPLSAIIDTKLDVATTCTELTQLTALLGHRIEKAQEAVTQQQNAKLTQLAAQPPQFPSTAQTPALTQALIQLGDSLPRPASTLEMSRTDVLEMAISTLALVTGGNAEKTVAALQTLRARPLPNCVPPPGAAVPQAPTGTAAIARNALYVLNTLPGGLTTASQLGAALGAPMSAAQMEAISTYLSAEQAYHQEKDPAVKDWLAGAMQVAQEQAHTGSVDEDPSPAKAAYAAVRSGLLSNAIGSTYHQLSQRLKQNFVTEIADASKERHFPDLIAKLMPPEHVSTGNSSYARTNVGFVADTTQRSGLSTGATQADQQVRSVTEQLKDYLPQGNDANSIALRTVLSHLNARSTPDTAGRPLSDFDINNMAMQVTNDLRESKQAAHSKDPTLRQRAQYTFDALVEAAHDVRDQTVKSLQDALDQTGVPGQLQSHVPALTQLVKPGDTATQALVRVLAAVTKAIPEPQLKQVQQTLQSAQGVEAAACIHQIQTVNDLQRLMDPLLANIQQGDSVDMHGGGKSGASLPYLPLGAVGPITASLASAYQHERGNSFGIKRDPTGILFSVGSSDQHGGTAQIYVGAKFVSPAGKTAVTTGVRHERSERDASALILRVTAAPNDEDGLRKSARKALKILDEWSVKAEGADKNDPLGYLLSRLHNLDVIHMSELKEKKQDTEISLRVGQLFPVPLPNFSTQASQTEQTAPLTYDAGVQVSLAYAFGTQHTTRADASGLAKVLQASSNASSQRVTLTAGLSLPSPLTYSKDLYREEVKTSLTATSIGARIDAQLEEQSLKPTHLLAELESNREPWIARAMAHSGSSRHTVVQALEAFEKTAKAAVADANKKGGYGQPLTEAKFVVNRTLSEGARVELETLESAGKLAALHGDIMQAKEIGAAREKLLNDAASWRAGTLFISHNTKEATAHGNSQIVIRQKTYEANASHVIAQFPAQTNPELKATRSAPQKAA